jgi:hypothetical protein
VDALALQPDEICQMCNTQKDFGGQRRRAAGWMFAARSCQIVVHAAPLYLSESLPSVYFILADIMQSLLEWRQLDPVQMSELQLKEFIHDWLRILVYDNGCSLHRYMRHAKRSTRTVTARLLALIPVVVDAFHFRGHKGCNAEGSCPLPEVWPATHQAILAGVDVEACEHVFAYMRRHAATARCFGPWRHKWFIHLIVHFRNVTLAAATESRTSKLGLFLFNIGQKRVHIIKAFGGDGQPAELRCGRKMLPENYEVRESLPAGRHVLCKWCFGGLYRS